MGKIRTKVIGSEEVEKEQAEKAKIRREAKILRQSQEKIGKNEGKDADVISQPENKEEVKKIEEEKKEKKTKKTKKTSVKQHVRGKKYTLSATKVDASKIYTIKDAVVLLKKIKYADFDETVELHLNLIDAGLKGEVSLPHGIGKEVKVAIVDDTLLSEIEGGNINFDILIAHPSFMPKLAKHARVLGPKGLMPNPKNGTVSEKPEEAAKKFAGGTLRYKSEAKFPLLHQSVGKLSFKEEQLVENIQAFIKAVSSAKIQVAFLKTTMSPSVRLSIQ